MKKLMMIVAMIGVIGMAGSANAIVQNNTGAAPFDVPPNPPIYTDYTGSYDAAANYLEPAGGDNNYHYDYPTTAPGGRYWTPGLTGTYVVEASWATGHNSDAAYYFRSDGSLGSEVAVALDVDQGLMADLSTPPAGDASWSGYFELGTFTLIPSSTFRIHTVGPSTSPITTGLWQFSEPGGAVVVPEPAGLGLIGLALLAVRRKRS